MRSEAGVDVFVIGLGLPEIATMTVEASSAMRACRTLFVNNTDIDVLKQACPDLRAIGDFGGDRGDGSRKRLIGQVLSIAKSAGPVGLALYGHPLIYEPVTTELARAAAAAGLRTRVVAGLSAFDSILSAFDFALTMGSGARICDPRYFLATEPEPGSLTILYRVFYPDVSLEAVAAHCRRAYPPRHRAALVEVANWQIRESAEWFSLDQLPRKAGRSMFTTIVIPPVAAAGAA